MSEHFRELPNRPNPPDIQPGRTDLPISNERPQTEKNEEGNTATELNGKVSSLDDIPSETFKVHANNTVELQHLLFGRIRNPKGYQYQAA